MSNVGMQILYHVVNEREGYLADRVYAPLVDMAALLRRTDQRLLSRESSRPLSAFDLIGFTLQYELCYTNVLYMLDLGGVPRRAAQRGEEDPFVMAGGPCAFNPEPMAPFLDFVVIGEGEEVILELMASLERSKAEKHSRAETLKRLEREVQGIYVPAHFAPRHRDDDGAFVELEPVADAPRWVERRIVRDLDKVPYPKKPVTPAITPVHERVSVEIQRGCTRSCRFCQAGYVYRPRRERDPNQILDTIDQSLEATGMSEVGMLSLSSADYSQLRPLMTEVMRRYKDRHLGISLPSTRLEALDESYLEVLKEERRSGFTIAPEAGSQRLRNVINKNFTEDEVVQTARMLFRNGWPAVKMYFMIGQPTETDADVIAIAELANAVIRKTSDIAGRKSVTVSVSNFVPKPHTPFQWHEQIKPDEILRKQKLIREHIAYRDKIQFRCHNADNSFVEGLVARGGRRAADLIERAYDLGAVFDCWQDKLDVSIWKRAVDALREETGHDAAEEGLRGRSLEERLPWHRIHCGIHPKFFKNEYLKAIYGIATEDCSFSACHECGLCSDRNGIAPVVFQSEVDIPPRLMPKAPEVAPVARSFRFQYKKLEAGVYVTVLDLQQLFIRAFTRAGLHLAYDAGIRPRPKLAMGPALPLGVASTCELFDLEIFTELEAPEILARTNKYLPEHLSLMTGAALQKGDPALPKLIRAVSFRVTSEDLTAAGYDATLLEMRVAEMQAAPKLIVSRVRKSRDGDERESVVDLKDSLEALRADGEGLAFTLYAPGGQAVNPFLVLDAVVLDATVKTTAIPLKKTGFTPTATSSRPASG